MISVVIPTFNEVKLGFLEKNLKLFAQFSDIEVICCDGGSTDGTVQLISQSKAKLLQTQTQIRAQRINIAVQKATKPMLLIHHPRSVLSQEAMKSLEKIASKKTWGAFCHRFDKKHYLLNFTSWYSNKVRGNLRNIYYLDHCIFLHRDFISKVFPLPHVEIFEDTILSQRLKRITTPIVLPHFSTTSSVRFFSNGIFYQILLNQILKLCFFLNISPKKMNLIYEKKLNLNGK